jgi:hypothetical protein
MGAEVCVGCDYRFWCFRCRSCLYHIWRPSSWHLGTECVLVQAPLMVYASSTVAAMEKHRGEAELVQSGLRLLANLAEADENKVSLLQTFQ